MPPTRSPTCTNAGITVTMLTGDEPQVARTVARKVGINARRVVTGRTLDDMTDTALGTELRRVNVFAKLTPEHKARIVSLLRREGHCVGYMGDGVNDLPAMHASEIAISASTGSRGRPQSADVNASRTRTSTCCCAASRKAGAPAST